MTHIQKGDKETKIIRVFSDDEVKMVSTYKACFSFLPRIDAASVDFTLRQEWG
jgi:hypothetical protein